MGGGMAQGFVQVGPGGQHGAAGGGGGGGGGGGRGALKEIGAAAGGQGLKHVGAG